jgi:2OG-Fe(II) oxygenase superfamily
MQDLLPPPLAITTDILTITPLEVETPSGDELSPDSLFDDELLRQAFSAAAPLKPPPGARTIAASPEDDEEDHLTRGATTIARRSAPPIPGLFFDPTLLLLPADFADTILRSCMTTFFAPRPPNPNPAATAAAAAAEVNQVMLFSRAGYEDATFPPFLNTLLAATSEILLRHPALPRETHALLFPPQTDPQRGHQQQQQQQQKSWLLPRARQAIINLYRPGEGIAPHVDLLNRFGDGIVGVSLGGGVAMRFERARTGMGTGGSAREPEPGLEREPGLDGQAYEVWLPPRSVLVLTGEARYEWTHGIAPRTRDRVEDGGSGSGSGWEWQERGVRVSVTFRWLLPGAEIVGGGSDEDGDVDEDEDDHRGQAQVEMEVQTNGLET